MTPLILRSRFLNHRIWALAAAAILSACGQTGRQGGMLQPGQIIGGTKK